jgi:hypothetical protein
MHLKVRAMIKSGKKAGAGLFYYPHHVGGRRATTTGAPLCAGTSYRRAFSDAWPVKDKPRWIPWFSFLLVNY